MSDMLDFAEKAMRQTTELHQRMIEIGKKIERDNLLPYLQAIFNAYRQALADPKYAMPPALHLALADAQRLVGEIRGLQPARNFVKDTRAAWEKDQQGTYDMSPRGGSLRPGS